MRKYSIALIGLLLLASFAFSQSVDWDAVESEAEQLMAQYGASDLEELTQMLNDEKAQCEADATDLEAENAELDNKILQIRKIQDFYKNLYADDDAYVNPPKGDYDIYVVVEGDWLSKLAEYPEVYGWGNYARWPEIYEANKDLIKDPDLIYPGWELKIPRP